MEPLRLDASKIPLRGEPEALHRRAHLACAECSFQFIVAGEFPADDEHLNELIDDVILAGHNPCTWATSATLWYENDQPHQADAKRIASLIGSLTRQRLLAAVRQVPA